MDQIPVLNIFGLREPLFPRAESSQRRFTAARERALSHPLIGGQLLSDDGRTLLMLVKFDWLFLQSDDDCMSGLRHAAESAAAKFPGVDLSFQVTGRAPITITLLRTHRENQRKYQIIGYSVVVLMAIVLFRGIRAVLIVSLAPCLGVFWTLGFLRFFDLQDNPFNDVLLPVMLSLVGLTDGVHLMVEIRRQSAMGSERPRSRPRGAAQGRICLPAHVAHHGRGFRVTHSGRSPDSSGVRLEQHAGRRPDVRGGDLVIPLACSTWLGRGVHVGHERGLIDRNLLRIGGLIEFVLARARGISWLAILITLLLVGCR